MGLSESYYSLKIYLAKNKSILLINLSLFNSIFGRLLTIIFCHKARLSFTFVRYE